MNTTPVIPVAGLRRASSVILAAAVSSAVLLGVSAHAAATTSDWTPAGEADWSVAADWTPSGVPNSLNTYAVITNGFPCDYSATHTNIAGGLYLGTNSFGTVNMTGGTLSVSNSAGQYVFIAGGGVPATGSLGNIGGPGVGVFNMSGGTLNIARDTGGFQQDSFILGESVGSSGTFNLSGGIVNMLCGMEMGIDGMAILNVSGGALVDTGWFHIGEGMNSASSLGAGSSLFNLSGGAVYILPNSNGPTTGNTLNGGLTLGYDVSNAVANISGGSVYCCQITMSAYGGVTSNTLNIVGGSIYVGNSGVESNSPTFSENNQVNISGGTFHTADMVVYGSGGTLGSTNNIKSDGTNWSWMATVPVNLTNSTFSVTNGVGGNATGPGYVTFAPEANRTITLDNQWFGVGGMTINGPGTVSAGASNVLNFTGPLTFPAGTLALGAAGVFGTSFNNPVTVAGGTLAVTATGAFNGYNNSVTINSGIMYFSASNTYANSLVLNGGALALAADLNDVNGLTFNGGSVAILNGGAIADSPLNLPASGSLIFTNTSAITFTNIIAGPGNVLVNNSGVVNLGSNLQNTGTVTQNNGILVLSGAIFDPNSVTNSGPASVGPLLLQGEVMSPIGIGTNSSLEAGSTIQPGTALASNVVLNGTWIEKLNTATTVGGGVNDLLICSNLTLNPSSVLLISPLSQLSVGSYVIAEYSGTRTGTFGTVTNGTADTMSISYPPGEVVLTVGSINQSTLEWSATNLSANINWDVNTSSNWTNTATSTLSTFHQLDAVKFDAAPGTGITNRVAITGQVIPSSIEIGGGLPYLFSGFGYISGATGIAYNDTNTSGIYTSGNNFTGNVNINNGVLQLGASASSWLGISNSTIVNGGTLDLNAQAIGNKPLVIQGSGSAYAGTNNGAINNSATSSPGQSAGPLNITLAGDTTLNASGARWDIGITSLGAGGGSFTGNNHNLTKIGNQPIWMHEVGDIGVGNIDIQQGLLGFEYTIGMGNSGDMVTVESGATLGFYQLSSNSILDKTMILNGNATLSSGGGTGTSNNFIGPITLNGSNTIATSIYPLNLPGNITGPGGFTVSGTGPLLLGGDDTYSGSTFIAANSLLALESGGSIPSTPLIYMVPSSNTVLDASGAGSMTLNIGQTLEGAGSVRGAFTANSGSSIIPGTNATTYGTIVFTNTLTLNGNTNDIKISDSANNGIDNDLIYVNGLLTLDGVSTIVITPLAALNSGSPYTVMQAAGGITGTAANLRIISTSPRYTMTPSVGGTLIQVNIMGNAAPLLWQGTLTPNWDLVTSNWYNMSTASRDHFYTGDDPTFDDTASVNNVVLTNNVIAGGIYMSNVTKTYTFSGGGVIKGPLNMYGNGSAGGTVILAMSNAPALNSVDSQFGNLVYDIQGLTNYNVTTVFGDSSGVAQGNITFGGTNTVNLLSDNYDNVLGIGFFDGMIWVTNGILRYTNEFALGRNSLGEFNGTAIDITNSGTLDINGVPLDNAYTPHISGNGFKGQGALYDSLANAMTSDNPPSGGGGFYNLVLDADATIGSPNNLQQNIPAGSGPGQVNGQGFDLTKVGTGLLTFFQQNDGDTHFGNIDVVAGRLSFQGYSTGGNSIALGDPTKLLSVESNATLTFFAIWNGADPVHNGVSKLMWLKGGAILDSSGNSSGNSNNFDGPVFLSGANLILSHGDLHLWDSVMDSNGPGGFIVGNNSEDTSVAGLWLDGTNTYSGSTIISNAEVHVGANSTLGLSRYVQVSSGAALDLSATPGYNFGTVQTNQTMGGNGTIIGPAGVGESLNFNAGGTLAIGLATTNGAPNTNTYTLTIDNDVVFNAGSTNYVVANKTSAAPGAVPADKLTGPSSLTLGGAVVVTNYGGQPFVGGDSLALFSATAISTNSGFNIVPATPGPNLAWNISSIPVNGTLGVVSTMTVNTTPVPIQFSQSGNQLTLNWPADHTGWELEVQTNNLSTGLIQNWVPYPSSTSVDSITIPINVANGTVFYRLVYPPQ